MTIVLEQCCRQHGNASVRLGLAPLCRSGVGIQTTMAFQQKALITCNDLVWRLFFTREWSRKAKQKGLESLTFQQLVFTETNCWLCYVPNKENPIAQFLEMASDDVKLRLNPVKVSGKTEEVIGSWIKSRQLQQETKKGSPFSHLGRTPKFCHLWWRLSLQVMDTRCHQDTVEKPVDFCLALYWSVFQAEILHITYAGCYFKMFLSTGQCCPLLPSVTLKLKLGGVEAYQFQVVPKASLHL